MPFLLRDKTDIKIFVLYLLYHIGCPLDFVTLHDVAVQDGFVGQFDFMECFSELCETDAIRKYETDATEYYTLTPSGKDAVETLQSDLLRTIREKALRSAKRFLDYRENGRKAESEIVPLENGMYRLICRCLNREGTYMETAVTVENKHRAELLKLNFDDRSELIYNGIMSLLSGDMNYLLPDEEKND